MLFIHVDKPNYYDLLLPTLTLPDRLAATFKKVVPVRISYTFTLEERNEVQFGLYVWLNEHTLSGKLNVFSDNALQDVCKYNNSVDDESQGILLSFPHWHAVGLYLGIGPCSCEAIEEV